MGKYKVTRLEKKDYEDWDEFVKKSPQGTLFHTIYWHEKTSSDFEVYNCFKGEELIGGVPVPYSELGGLKVVHPPRLTPYGGPIFNISSSKYVSKLSTQKKVSSAIIKKLKEDFACVYNWAFSPQLTDLQPFMWKGFNVDVNFTYILPLDNLAKIWQEMDKKRRNDIRKSEENLHVEAIDKFEEMYKLVEKTFTRKEGFRAKSKSFLIELHKTLREKNRCKTFLSKDEKGNPMAGVYIVWDNEKAYELLSGFDPEKASRGANPLAVWESIKFAKEELGLNYYDFEGSSIPGVEKYYRYFGGKLTPKYQVSWSKSSILLWLIKNDLLRSILKGFR